MKVAGVLFCLLGTAVAVYPEAPGNLAKNTAARTTQAPTTQQLSLDVPLVTEVDVRSWLDVWQRRLGLTEWRIEAKIVRLSQLQKGTIANIHWSLPKRTATIKVLDPIDSNLARTEIVRDTELSVVHELIHLTLAKLPLDGSDTDLEEETVKKISTALLLLDKPVSDRH